MAAAAVTWVVYCPTHAHYLAFVGVSGTTWVEAQADAKRYTKTQAHEAAKRATWLDHRPTVWALPAVATTWEFDQ